MRALAEYATTVLRKFSKYWDALYSISKQIRSVAFDDEEIKQEYEKYMIRCKEQKIKGFDFETVKKACKSITNNQDFDED